MKIRFPGFKILDRYILGKFLATYFFAIAMMASSSQPTSSPSR